MRRSTMGPFPKSVRWHQLLNSDPAGCDRLLEWLIKEYRGVAFRQDALDSLTFLIGLVVCTRGSDPHFWLNDRYDILVEGDPTLDNLTRSLTEYVDVDTPARRAAIEVLKYVTSLDSEGLFDHFPWRIWRDYDGRKFCDFSRLFFAKLNEQFFRLAIDREEIRGVHRAKLARFAWEMATITPPFSARWFNACARQNVPESGSIHWYLRHCLGKLELELEREKSDWEELSRNFRKAKPNRSARLL